MVPLIVILNFSILITIYINREKKDIYLIKRKFKEFDITNGKIIKQIKKHSSTILGLKLVKDKNCNKYFVSYGQNKHIYLWKLN